MRDLQKYPITADEIQRALAVALSKALEEESIGYTNPDLPSHGTENRQGSRRNATGGQ